MSIKDFNIISAVDDNYKYLSFVPSVAEMWFNITGKKMIIGFVTIRDDNDSLIEMLNEIVDVKLFRPIVGIHTGNQAKVTRMYLASDIIGNNMIVDIDMYVLNNKITEWVGMYVDNTVTSVGANAYYNSPAHGRFPMCYTMGNRDIFHDIINPYNMDYTDVLNSWSVIDNPIDGRENIRSPHHIFSDESLMRYLIYKTNNTKNIINIIRDDFIGQMAQKRIDRANDTRYNKDRLYSGYYIDCAPNRPLDLDKMMDIFYYLNIKRFFTYTKKLLSLKK